MPGIISIREGCYGPWEAAVERVTDAGIYHLEVNARPLEELKKISEAADAKGVKILTLSSGVNLDSEASCEDLVQMIVACEKLAIPIFFVSAGGTEAGRPTHMARLKGLGEEAEAKGVVLALETHPPFCKNAEGMLATMADVANDHVRLNLDTANIYYYNHGLDSADELEKVIDYVASVHLKDTDGGFESPNFPVLGLGIVRFPRIREILEAAAFDGPLTMELEGPVVEGLDADGAQRQVIACMDYLRSVGLA